MSLTALPRRDYTRLAIAGRCLHASARLARVRDTPAVIQRPASRSAEQALWSRSGVVASRRERPASRCEGAPGSIVDVAHLSYTIHLDVRVLYAPVDVAGQASLSVRGLRACGVDADLFAAPHPFRYDAPDIIPPARRLAYMRAMLVAARSHDVFHFSYGVSFLRPSLRLIDARSLRHAGKRVIVEFYGSDVRMPSLEAQRNPHYVRIPGEDDGDADLLMRRWSQVTDGHVVTCDPHLDLFLNRHFAHVHHVRHRVDVSRYRCCPPRADAALPTVAHAPSNIAGKGTVHVRRAVEELRSEGTAFDYLEIHGASHDEVLRGLERADLVIDQLCSGNHGVLSVEAMSLGKPVICYLLPETKARMPSACPIINADPMTIKQVLREWLVKPGERHRRGVASRAYVEQHHDIRFAARHLIEIYESLPRSRKTTRTVAI
jgi:hypothetical protein